MCVQKGEVKVVFLWSLAEKQPFFGWERFALSTYKELYTLQ